MRRAGGTKSPSPTVSPGGMGHLASGILFNTDPFLFHSLCLSYHPKGALGRVALGRAQCPRAHTGVRSTVLGDGRVGPFLDLLLPCWAVWGEGLSSPGLSFPICKVGHLDQKG